MGTRIESAVTSLPGWFRRGALHMSDVAAKACLERGHRRAEELDLLINTGLYKDRNAAEPALAAIIQEDIGANPGSPIRVGHHGTFSFDLVDGGCGVIQAAQLVDGFVGQGRARLAMIVAADADPSPSTSRNFPFTSAGGAMLLAHADGDVGFHHFRIRTFPQYAGLFESRLRWDPRAGVLGTGRNVVEVLEAPEFADRCIDCAADVVRALLADASLATADIDVVIASQYPATFATRIAARLGISKDRVPIVPRELSGGHTAGPIAALEAAIASGQLATGRHALFVTAGAGITIGAALYRA